MTHLENLTLRVRSCNDAAGSTTLASAWALEVGGELGDRLVDGNGRSDGEGVHCEYEEVKARERVKKAANAGC